MLNLRATPGGWLSSAFAACVGSDCVLCAERSADLLCVDCAAALPASAPACARCALPLPSAGICGRCLREPPHFDDAIAALQYRFPVDRLMQRFKYAGDLAIGRWLGAALMHRVRDADRPDLVVAPPSTNVRLRSRGFNPGLEIAKSVARAIGVRCAIDGLLRARETTPQPGLGRRERERNLEGALRCERVLDGQHVAIVDDVMTTGATANAAAKVLRDRGAARVSVWVVARTPEPHV
jgi:ComF family protein